MEYLLSVRNLLEHWQNLHNALLERNFCNENSNSQEFLYQFVSSNQLIISQGGTFDAV